jgi:hypothetical protein
MAVCAASLGFAKLVFVTNATYQGDLTSATQPLTGVAGGNADCQAEANAAGLPGTYKAWLSDFLGNYPATTFTHSTVPYALPNQNLDQVASNWAGLTSGANLLHLIDVSAQGATTDNQAAWTNTDISGHPNTNDCNNWTQSAHGEYLGQVGDLTLLTYDHGWTNSSTNWCDPVFALICFQQ